MGGSADAGRGDASSVAQQSVLVGTACAADLAINYPLWLTAKRISAGLSFPSRSEMYKGAFAVWLSYFPTMLCEEDFSHRLTSMVKYLAPRLGKENQDMAAAAAAGAISGLIVAAPTENVVTRAHATGESVLQALRSTVRMDGVRGALMPFGMAAMVGREVPFTIGIFTLRDYFTTLFHQGPGSASAAGSTTSTETSTSRRGGSLRWWTEELASSVACATTVNLAAHPPSAILSLQQAHRLSLGEAIRQVYSTGGIRGFYSGFMCRSLSIGGTMFVIPTVLSLGNMEFGASDWIRSRLGELRGAVQPVQAEQLQRV